MPSYHFCVRTKPLSHRAVLPLRSPHIPIRHLHLHHIVQCSTRVTSSRLHQIMHFDRVGKPVFFISVNLPCSFQPFHVVNDFPKGTIKPIRPSGSYLKYFPRGSALAVATLCTETFEVSLGQHFDSPYIRPIG